MRALVTGSTGFVGANLVEGLAKTGRQVWALHRARSRLDGLVGLKYKSIIGDILDPLSLERAMRDVDWVFHVAAVADYWRQRGTAWLYRVNVGGTRNVLEAALEAGVQRVILTSSVAALGVPSTPGDGPIDESASFNLPPAQFAYGHSKYLAERVAHEFVARGLDVVILNPTIVLGPRDLNLISGSLVCEVFRRRLPVIPPGGVNYIDVSDVVAGHIAAAERGRPGERYILGAHNLTHHQAIMSIARVVGVPAPRYHLPARFLDPLAIALDLFNRVWPGDPPAQGYQLRLLKHMLFVDTSKARQELKLCTPLPFEETVERSFRWYCENGYL